MSAEDPTTDQPPFLTDFERCWETGMYEAIRWLDDAIDRYGGAETEWARRVGSPDTNPCTSTDEYGPIKNIPAPSKFLKHKAMAGLE